MTSRSGQKIITISQEVRETDNEIWLINKI